MAESSLAVLLDRAKFYAGDAIASIASCICRPDATLKINGRTYTIVRLLGEGGFSFVYLAKDDSSGTTFALKKIRCPTSSAVRAALAEVEAYRRFAKGGGDNLIKCLDSAVVQDEGGEGKIVWVFLPFYPLGNLQDIINRALVSPTSSPQSEKALLTYFLGTCKAVRAMHKYQPSVRNNSTNPFADGASSYPPAASTVPTAKIDKGKGKQTSFADDDEDEDVGPSGENGMALLGSDVREGDDGFDDDVDTEEGGADEAGGTVEGGFQPWAHRDIKPANIMYEGSTPILMDLGSCMKARIHIKSRQEALLQQDIAAEHSSMPYRAPELFDVKTNTTLDEKVDIWSLGCTLFAVAYNFSPFEDPMNAGGSIAMAVASGSYRHPNASPYSENFKKLVDACIKVQPERRPDIDELIKMTLICIEKL